MNLNKRNGSRGLQAPPNVVGIELNNGQKVIAPTEAWIIAILNLLDEKDLAEVVKQALSMAKEAPSLYTADGRAVKFASFDDV